MYRKKHKKRNIKKILKKLMSITPRTNIPKIKVLDCVFEPVGETEKFQKNIIRNSIINQCGFTMKSQWSQIVKVTEK